ncbi:MAG: YlxR family protein [Clostridia bacterium]|nr:YlxR family protein [Clostridia bacterium]
MKNKKLTRTCIGCRTKKEKKELVRIVRNKQNEILVDLDQALDGRGAYICNNLSCFEKTTKGNKLKVALKENIDNKKYEELRGVIFDRVK